MKKGLVLEGGGMRGMFTAGVLDVLMEEGIIVDGIVGVSAGAVFGCNMKSNQPGRSIRYNVRYCKDPRYSGIRTLIKTGDIFGAKFCYHYLPKHLDYFDVEAFKSSPIRFYVVTTDMVTGKPIYHALHTGGYYDLEWMRASASLPLVSRPVKIGRFSMLDGGIADSIPLQFFEGEGYQKNVVVLTRPAGYVKKGGATPEIMKLTMGKSYPELCRTMKERPQMYNNQIKYVAEREAAGAAFVIRPPEELPVGRVEHNPERLIKAYNIGKKEAKKRLKELKRFLGE